MIVAIVFLAIFFSTARHVSAEFPLTILHTNDVHARFINFNDRQRPCEPEDLRSNKCWGGAARRLTAMKKFRREEQNVLTLDAGDQFQGTLWYTALKWEPIAKYMNVMGYDAMAFGNHEFDDGLEGLEPFIRNLSIPMVNSNIEDNGSQIEGLFRRKLIKEIGGQRIGIVGCTTVETPKVARPGPTLNFGDEVRSLQPQVDELIAAGVNKIIVVSHAGISVDRRICQQVKGVDIVVGGHSHTFLWSGRQPSIEPPEGPYPEEYVNNCGAGCSSNCLVVQDYAYGKYLGKLKVTFDDQGVLRNWSGNNPVPLDAAAFPEDETVASILRPYQGQLEHFQKTVAAKTAVAIDGVRRSCRLKECNLGSLLADAALWFYIKRQVEHPSNSTEGWSASGIALWNGGGVRDFETPAGSNITLEDLYTIMPFQNTIDMITLKGIHLKEAFEHAVSDYNPSDAAGKFLQVSGIKVVYDLSKPNGQRVKRLRVRCNECGVPTYKNVEFDKVYSVVTHTYVSGGGDGFAVLRDHKMSSDGSNALDTDVVLDYIKTYKPLITGEELRIEFANGNGDTSAFPQSPAPVAANGPPAAQTTPNPTAHTTRPQRIRRSRN